MNVLCVGYYDKFSRFFLGIRKELKNEFPDLNFKLFNLYFSGFFYAFIRGVPSYFLSFRARCSVFLNYGKYAQIIAHQSHYQHIFLENLIGYQLKLNKSASKKQLLLQAVAYIDHIEKELETFRPDVILLVGDSRLLIEITKQLAVRRGIRTYYIEQGPFGTSVFDQKGVNANASIRDFHVEIDKIPERENIDRFINRKRSVKYHRSPFYRGMDYLLHFLLQNTRFYPPDLKIPEPLGKKYRSCKDDRFKKLGTGSKDSQGKNVFLLVCQVPFDVNMTHHSPHFESHSDILKYVYRNMPKNSLLLVREHPLYKGKYEESFYDQLLKKDIFIDCNTDLEAVFEQTDVVIVNNSTVGLEALAKNKPVVVLGNSYYDSEKLCLKLHKKEDLSQLLLNSLVFKPGSEEIKAFLNEFIFNHLIEGQLTDKNLSASRTIAKKIGSMYLSG